MKIKIILKALILIFAGYIFCAASMSHAEPGWIFATGDPVSPEEDAIERLKVKETSARKSARRLMSDPAFQSPEIIELAAGLKNDPKLIYEFVHNHIDYVPYFGSLKGATLALLEKSGNDFDQASLMIALLKSSGVTDAKYVYGTMTIPVDDVKKWLCVDSAVNANSMLSNGGIPVVEAGNNFSVSRVWVQAVIDGATYQFDPAFKRYHKIFRAGGLAQEMGYSRTVFLASAGGTTGTNYVQNLNESSVRTKLAEYSAALSTDIRTRDNLDRKMNKIIGGKEIIPEYLNSGYPTSLTFSVQSIVRWTKPPEGYEHTVRIQYGEIDMKKAISSIAGKRLSITYDDGTSPSRRSMQENQKIYLDPEKIKPEPIITEPVVMSEAVPGSRESHSDRRRVSCGFFTFRQPMINFGKINNGVSSLFSKPFRWTSGSNQPADFRFFIEGDAFSIKNGGGPFRISSGSEHTLEIECGGDFNSPGVKTGELQHQRFNANSNICRGEDQYPLTVDIRRAPNLGGSYGAQTGAHLNSPQELTCRLNNSGPLPLTVQSVALGGSNTGNFQIIRGNSAGTIPASSHRDIVVQYRANAVGTHNARILVELSPYDQADHNLHYSLPLEGTTTNPPPQNNRPTLWLEDAVLQTAGALSAGEQLTLSIDHPYSADGGTFCDQSVTYNLTWGATYAIISDFGGGKEGTLLKNRQRILNNYKASGLSDNSKEVLCETLNVIGQTWMRQTTLNSNLLEQLSGVLRIRHHRFGIVAQEQGYYIDVKAQTSSTSNDSSGVFFKSSSYLGSALEHGVLEQLQINKPAASTVKLLQLANSSGAKIFKADRNNYSGIKSQLTGYSAADKSAFQTDVNNGATLILPARGNIGLEQWEGKGYINFSSVGGDREIGMIIGGGYHGGYGALRGDINTNEVRVENAPEIRDEINVDHSESKDPVDLVTGAFLFDATDLALGPDEPRGLRFRRSYNSFNKENSSGLGCGWTHNYDIRAQVHSDGSAGLGLGLPVDAAALIVASYVTLDLMDVANPDVKKWALSALVAKWAMDQLINNAVSLTVNSKSLTFIKLPDGTYNSPAGVTMTLEKRSTGNFRLNDRFGVQIDFNSNNAISTWRDAEQNSMSFTYSGGKLSRVTDSFGRYLQFNHSGQTVRITDSASPQRNISYQRDANDDLVTYTDAENKKWNYVYDTNHNLRELKAPDGSSPSGTANSAWITTATNRYNTLGKVDRQTVPRQDPDNPAAYIDAHYNYLYSGVQTIEQDPENGDTTYTFDDSGRTIKTSDPLSNASYAKYDGLGHIWHTIDANEKENAFVYNGDHNLVAQINASLDVTTYKYDAQFRKTDIIDPAGRKIHFDYHPNHHLKNTIAYPEQYNTITTANTYYASGARKGLLHATTDGRNITTTMTYDSYGNPATSVTGSRSAVTYSYDRVGNMLSLTDPEGAVTRFTYDKRGLIKTKTDPLGRITRYAYYDDGRLYTVTDRKNKLTEYRYTKSGKTKSVTFYNSGTASGSASRVDFKYDTRDNLKTMTDSFGTTTYGYDAANRLISVMDAQGFTIGYSYYPGGNLKTLTYPGGKKVFYTYDALNRVRTVNDWLGQTAVYTYDKAGNLDTLQNFNGTVRKYSYDSANRLISIIDRKSGGAIIVSYAFELDGNGNRTEVTDGGEALAAHAFSADKSIQYGYNAKKNRLDSITTDGASKTLSHDNEGQLSLKGSASYTFDLRHRLANAGAAQYFYDGANRRIKAFRNRAITKYIYDASGNLLAEANSGGAITRYYIYGTGLLGTVRGNAAYCYHFDANANTVALTDGGQSIVNKYAYTPFGMSLHKTEGIAQPFTFVGEYGVMEEADSLYYMRARYYDAGTGRFISEDPLGFDGGTVNLYEYAGDNPVLFVDPNGLFAKKLIIGIAKKIPSKVVQKVIGKIFDIPMSPVEIFTNSSGTGGRARTDSYGKIYHQDEIGYYNIRQTDISPQIQTNNVYK